MITYLVNALLQPKYSSEGPIPPAITSLHIDTNYNRSFNQDFKQDFTKDTKYFGANVPRKLKDIKHKRRSAKYSTKIIRNRIQSKTLDNFAEVTKENHAKLQSNISEYTDCVSKNSRKVRRSKIINAMVRSIINRENPVRTFIDKEDPKRNVYDNSTRTFLYNNKNRNNGINNINIKHLKLFKAAYYTNTQCESDLTIYSQEQLNAIDNSNKNVHTADNAHGTLVKLHIYNSECMPKIEGTIELNTKLPISLYNTIAIELLDMIFDHKGWQRMEKSSLNITCYTPNGNLYVIDKIWWNMQIDWTSCNMNWHTNGTKEFTINYEAKIDDMVYKNMAIYKIIDGRKVPIYVGLYTKSNYEHDNKDRIGRILTEDRLPTEGIAMLNK
jgi:hypothetical protein